MHIHEKAATCRHWFKKNFVGGFADQYTCRRKRKKTYINGNNIIVNDFPFQEIVTKQMSNVRVSA